MPRPADTLADGMTPPFVGALPLEIAREAVDEIVTVTEEEILEAMRLLMTRAKLYVEGSGAAATAALLVGQDQSAARSARRRDRVRGQRGSREGRRAARSRAVILVSARREGWGEGRSRPRCARRRLLVRPSSPKVFPSGSTQ